LISARKNDWEIIDTIRETISGTKKIEDREEIAQLKQVVLQKNTGSSLLGN
jgi:hypothetical protein